MRIAIWATLAAFTATIAPAVARGDPQYWRQQEGNLATVAEEYDATWSSTEKKAWTQIREGRQVTLRGRCPEWARGHTQTEEEVDASAYTISGQFLGQIMTENPYRTITKERGIGISGAQITGNVVVEGGRSNAPVTIACSTIEGEVRIVGREMDRTLRLYRVRASKGVYITEVNTRSDVIFQKSDIESVSVKASRIDGALSLRGTRVRGKTTVVATTVGHGPLMGCWLDIDNTERNGCHGHYGETHFISVKTEGLMELDRSTFVDEVRLQEVEVGGSLLARRVKHIKGFTVMGGTINGRLEMDGGPGHGKIEIQDTRTRGGLALRKGTYPDVSILGAEVNKGLDFRGSNLRRLDLSGTTVAGELRLGIRGGDVDWGNPGKDAIFIARNTRVRSLQDTESTWPSWLRREFDGFEYKRLGGLEDDPRDVAYLRNAEWFKEWLASDESYSPQPYRHLSDVLRAHGQKQTANAVLYEGKERERRALAWTDAERWWLEFLRWTIGYGVGRKAFHAILWMVMFCGLGWGTAVFATRGKKLSKWKLLWHSVSNTVPGFNVAKEDKVTMPTCATNWFYTQRLICYGLALLAAVAAVGLIEH